MQFDIITPEAAFNLLYVDSLKQCLISFPSLSNFMNECITHVKV